VNDTIDQRVIQDTWQLSLSLGSVLFGGDSRTSLFQVANIPQTVVVLCVLRLVFLVFVADCGNCRRNDCVLVELWFVASGVVLAVQLRRDDSCMVPVAPYCTFGVSTQLVGGFVPALALSCSRVQ
jgi:hypothetical protein